MNAKARSILFAVAAVGLLVSTQGCDSFGGFGNDFLEKPPSVDVTADTIFTSALYAQRFLWGAYETLPYNLPMEWSDRYNQMGMDQLESLTDLNQSYLSWAGVMQLYYSGQYSAGNDNGDNRTKYSFYNSGAWDGIRRAHIFIANIDRVPDMDQAMKERLKAEAKMIKAVHYTDLFRHYGGMIWINHAYGPNEDFTAPRMTARATMDSIVALIDEAIPNLPFELANPNTESGRFTQAGAMGLKARVLLFGASPLFNDDAPYLEGEAADEKMVWFGGYDASLWQDVADAAKALIDRTEGSSYHLKDTGNPRQDFQDAYYDRDSPELLISTRYKYKAGGKWEWNNYYLQAVDYGIGNPTDNYVTWFPMADGTPISDPNSGYDPQHPYANRDPRLYETVLVNDDVYQGRQSELWIGGRDRRTQNGGSTASGYRMRKFILDVTSAEGSVIQWPYLRLPEIYLTYAEALNEINGGPTAEAYRFVNRVRNRVDLNDLPTGLSQAEFREAVLRERALEFGYEQVRWFDLIRWKMDEDFTKTLYGMNIWKEDDGSLRFERFALPDRYWKNNWSPKWYLSALPPDEINKGYGLVQNPGW